MKSLVEKAQARVKRIEDSLTRTPMYHYQGQRYYYVLGFTKAGHVTSLGPFMSESDASAQLVQFDDGEIFEYATRDLAKATRQMKAELLARGEEPDEALRRMLHEKGLEREQERGGN